MKFKKWLNKVTKIFVVLGLSLIHIYTKKTLKTSHGEVEIESPRDRDGSFEPVLVLSLIHI